MSECTKSLLTRRACLPIMAAAIAAPWSTPATAQNSQMPFDRWVDAFRARAHARGISDATYNRVMGNLKPDTAVFELDRKQPEFNEQLWQYLNRRVSDWRISDGKEKAKEHAGCSTASRTTTASSAAPCSGSGASSPRTATRSCRRTTCGRCIPALAALAWGEPRRRKPTGSRNCSTR